jgi:amino acid efflux transporter
LWWAALAARPGQGDLVLLDLAEAGGVRAAPALIGVVSAVVALGVLNVYLAAFGKLGASLASNGDLPRWFARGAESGAVPRRALLLSMALVLGYFAVAVATGFELQPFILIHTASMVAVYTIGMIAAIRILPRRTAGWWMAVIASVCTIGLLLLAGIALVVPAVVALVAAGVTLVRRGRERRRGAPENRDTASVV